MYVLGVDFGGGSSKATLIDQNGKVIKTASSEYKTYYGENGKAEQKPMDWYFAACKNIRSILENIDPKEVSCVCFDAATHTAVLCDENFSPVMDAIYWTDTRSIEEKKFLEQNYGEEIFNKCKHKVDTIWSLPEVLYAKKLLGDDYKKVKKILFAKDFVRHLFTGDYVTDYIEAEGSMFFDFDTLDWDDNLLSLIGFKKEDMPKIVSPLDFVGTVNQSASEDSGLAVGTKVICGSTDTAMEVFASGGVNKGDMTLKLATAGRICVVSDNYFADKNIINYSHLKKGYFYPGSATKSCASSLRWFRDNFGGDFEQFSDMAETVPIGSDGLIFHPYLMGELTPHANPHLRGAFTGLTAKHTKAHFVRSIMEGVTMSMLDCIKYLQSHGVKVGDKAVMLGGGRNSPAWRQMIADALNIKIIRTENNDSSFGSAMCAGIAVGLFKDYDDAIKTCSKVIGETLPIKENTIKYAKIFDLYKEISEFLTGMYNA